MADSPNSYYKVDSGRFLATVIRVPEAKRGEWVMQLALDLADSDVEKVTTEYAKKLILEADAFRANKVEAGRKGGQASGKARASKAQAQLEQKEAPLYEIEASQPTNQSTNQSENHPIIHLPNQQQPGNGDDAKMSFDRFCEKWSRLIGKNILGADTCQQLEKLHAKATANDIKEALIALETTTNPNHNYGVKVLESTVEKKSQKMKVIESLLEDY